MVDGDQLVELYSVLSLSPCGKSWGLTLGKHCMQSPYSVVIPRENRGRYLVRAGNDLDGPGNNIRRTRLSTDVNNSVYEE